MLNRRDKYCSTKRCRFNIAGICNGETGYFSCRYYCAGPYVDDIIVSIKKPKVINAILELNVE